MRQILAPLALLALAAAPCRADTITFARVWPQWHDSGSFESYHEYRTGKELVQDWIVMRTQPKSRSGLYFLTRVLNHGPALASATFTVRVIKPDSVETRVYSFPATVPAGSRLFEIGLTGTDWASSHVLPVAWEVELRSADGTLLAETSNFLWEKPGPQARGPGPDDRP
jgi:hypothetical protein